MPDVVASSPASGLERARPLVIALDGPLDTVFSLAIVNRGLAAALAARPDVEVVTDVTCKRATHAIRNMYPPRLDAGPADTPTYFYFAWEDSRIPSAWAQAFNRHLEGLLVPSTHVRDVVRRSGVAIPVAVVPYGIDASYASPLTPCHGPAPTRRSFRFLHVSTGFPRKGCDVLIRAFTREFSSADDVALVLKTLPQYDHPTARLVRRARWRWWRCPEIVHLDADLDAAAMQALYASASCLVHPARAEGFGLPLAEAMLAGIPVIASDCSGHTDFCTERTAALVPCRPAASRSPFVVEGASWSEPDEAALRRALRQAFEHAQAPGTVARVEAARAHAQGFTWPRAADRVVTFFRTLDAPRTEPIRAAMLTTWREPCGIAEYSRHLLAATSGWPVSWTILAPRRGDAAVRETPVGAETDRWPVLRCWSDAWPADLDGALAQIRRCDPHVVHVQTHLGIWSPAGVEALTGLARDGRRVFMTLHSTRGSHPEAPLVQALAKLCRLFVHTDADRQQLAAWGLDENVTVLAQGYPQAATSDRRSIRSTVGNPGYPMVGTYGFLRPHKGVIELIRAVARLRHRYPDIAVQAVTALYPSADSASYFGRCRREAERLGLADRCRFVTDFLEPETCLALLHACDVIALPYERTIDSSSAAVRMALASRRPVVTTDVPVFAEVQDAVLTVGRRTPRALAAGVVRVLEDEALRSRLAGAADQRLAEEAWTVVGRTYGRILRAAVSDFSLFESAYPMHSS